ncbi:Mannose-1-phosphate guanyltransferase [Verticillium dahliae VDG2]|nr:Mannose-1-phosphate guanyltransferase [Verticillium dahliae VDG2]
MSSSATRLKDEGSKLQVVTAGATAGLVSRFVIAPLDVVKIRLQLQSHSLSDPLSHPAAQGGPIYKGTLSTLRHILRSEGLPGLWKGNVPAELMYLCYGGIHVLAKTAVFPLDLVRKRIQVQGPTRARYVHKNIPEYQGALGALRTILRVEGVRGMYRGLVVSLVKAAPGSAVTVWTYERMLNWLIRRDGSGLDEGRV